ncbi:MAG TPA: ABC transporter ATP-binding protein [Dyadobacter sp.]|jgi:iron complex transport system ATP-binding protein|nr:ABC transporter ATP-binding protein [Dyadobacter sp.]
MSQPVIKAIDLSVGYRLKNNDSKIIAASLNLELHKGEMVCLLGPNGAGKSTLMKTLSGLQPVLAGSVEINGIPLSDVDASALARQLSLVLTERIEVGNLSVQDVVGLGRIPYTGWLGKLSDTDRKQVEWALEATETTVFRLQKMNNLSDGERQKVMLARALAQDTDLILLDEPTAHLDLPSRVEIMQLLHNLTRQHQKAILLSTHELDLALQAADRLWLMKKNGSLLTGTPEDMVLDGSFEDAFAKPGFYFDKNTGGFNIYQNTPKAEVLLTGIPHLVFWTKRALQREGISVTDNTQNRLQISVAENDNAPIWTLSVDGEDPCSASSIAILLSQLRTLIR